MFEAVEIFIKDSSRRGLHKNTVKHYEYALRHFLKSIGSRKRIDKITDQDFVKLRSYLVNNYSPPTVNSYFKSINTFLNWARKLYTVKVPPRLQMVKTERILPEFLTPDELDRIYNRCNDPKMLATFKVYEHTGIRLRELHNCELDESNSGNYIKLKRTKGKRERIVPIPPEIVEDFKLAMFGPYAHDSAICLPYKPGHISSTFSRLRRELRINSNKTIHSLRHTFALRKLLEIGNIYLVKEMLGHSDVKTTQIYLEFPEGYLKEVFQKWIPEIQKTKRQDAIELAEKLIKSGFMDTYGIPTKNTRRGIA